MEGGEQLNEVSYGSEVEKIKSQECINDSLDKEENMVVHEKLFQIQSESCVLQVKDEKIEITTGKDVNVGFAVAETVSMSEEVEGVSSFVHAESNGHNGSLPVNGRSVSGAKRARVTVDEHQPSVHIIYNSLTRASRHKLEELLKQWSEWHEKHVPSTNDPSEVLESGEETFFPALKVGHEKTSAVLFWMDNQTIDDQNKDFVPLNHNSVPLYDRGYALGLTSADGPSNLDGGLQIIDEAARCFNCGSYSHSLRDCTKPRDNVAINNARNQLKSRRNQNASSRNPTRYYQNSPTGKYAGLRPGALDDVTRKLLGLGELDPPPWLKRMREIGYPPGYLDVDYEDQPSGITIYTDKEIAEPEDGKITGIDKLKPKQKMTVEFPGINAPIPENADKRLWTAGAAPSNDTSNISRNVSQHRSNNSTDYGSRGHFRDQKPPGDLRDDAPPGDQGFSSPRFNFHPMHDGHDYVPRSSSMSRFQSELIRHPVHGEEPRHPSFFQNHPVHGEEPRHPSFFENHPVHSEEPRHPSFFENHPVHGEEPPHPSFFQNHPVHGEEPPHPSFFQNHPVHGEEPRHPSFFENRPMHGEELRHPSFFENRPVHGEEPPHPSFFENRPVHGEELRHPSFFENRPVHGEEPPHPSFFQNHPVHGEEPRHPSSFQHHPVHGEEPRHPSFFENHPVHGEEPRHPSFFENHPVHGEEPRHPSFFQNHPVHGEEPCHPSSFHSLYHSLSSERLHFPLDQDPGRFGNWSSGSLYDRDRDRPFQNRYMLDDWHYRV